MPTELPTSPVSETDEVETARGPKVWSGPGMGDSSVNMWIQSVKKGFFSRLRMHRSYRIPPFHCVLTEVTCLRSSRPLDSSDYNRSAVLL